MIENHEEARSDEFLKIENAERAEQQKKEVRKRVKEAEENPSILIDETVVFNMLNSD